MMCVHQRPIKKYMTNAPAGLPLGSKWKIHSENQIQIELRVIHSTRHKTGYFRDTLPSQSQA